MKWFLMFLFLSPGSTTSSTSARRRCGRKKAEQIKKDVIKRRRPRRPAAEAGKPSHTIFLQTKTQGCWPAIPTKSALRGRGTAGQLQDDMAPSYIKRMFQEETEVSVKKLLIAMVGKDKSKLSLALLAEAMNDYDNTVRLLAVETIGEFSNKEAILVLNKGMEDYDEDVRLKAVEAVNRIRRDIEAHKEQQLRDLEKKPLFRIE